MSEEKREISFQELVRILIEHRKWFISAGEQGRQANLAWGKIDCKKINLRMVFLPDANLRGMELNGVNLEGAYLSGANLMGASLGSADLRGALCAAAKCDSIHLYNAKLQGAKFYHADLKAAWLASANFQGAELFGADLQNAHLYEAKLNGADLRGVQFQNATLEEADLRDAKLQGANVSGANLKDADLKGAHLSGIIFGKHDKTASFKGVRVAECFGGEGFVRFANDQAWLEDFLDSRKSWWQRRWAWFWRISCDYGRSFGRWAILSSLLAVFFGCIFYILGPGAFDVAHLPEYPSLWGLISMIYYSVVTFTTLGFGDIIPKTIPAAIIVMTEVICGYIMLGGLISILANKLARRS